MDILVKVRMSNSNTTWHNRYKKYDAAVKEGNFDQHLQLFLVVYVDISRYVGLNKELLS